MSSSKQLRSRQTSTTPSPIPRCDTSSQVGTSSSSCPLLETNPTCSASSAHEHLNTVLMEVVKIALDKNSSQADLFHIIEMAVQDLLNADRASLFMLDHTERVLYAHILTFKQEESTLFNTVTLQQSSSFNDRITNLGLRIEPLEVVAFRGTKISVPIDEGITGLVARTGQLVNVPNVLEDKYFCSTVDKLTRYTTKTLLCAPLIMNGKVHGVLEAINSKEGVFSTMDEHLLQSIALVSGLYLQNSNLQKEYQLLEDKCKVTNEMLVYHRQCSHQYFQKIRSIDRSHIDQYDIESFGADSSLIPGEIKPHLFVKMVSNLIGESLFDKDQVLRFAITVAKNYRLHPYHNWNHAFQVAQSMYWILKNSRQHFKETERLALVVACLCHDLDHRSFNNSFMLATKHPLSQLYSSSILENHHLRQTIELLHINGLNIYSLLTDKEYKHVIDLTQKAIIATDLFNFFLNKEELSKVFQTGNFSWAVPRHKDLVICLMMTISDLCTACKSWDIHNKNIKTIFEEFYNQGDLEKALGMTPIKMMDRDYKDQMPSLQVGFITSIPEPCCKLLKMVLPHIETLLVNTVSNRIRWQGMIPSN